MSRFTPSRVLLSAFLTLAFMVGSLGAQGATGVITGKVTAKGTNQALAETRVVLVGTAVAVFTNAQGEYRIPNAPVGARQVTAYRVGYQAATDTVRVVAGQTSTLNLSMAVSRVQLSDVVVTGTVGNQERRAQAATVASVDVAQIAKESPAQNVAQLLQSRVPSVSVSSASGTAGTSRRINIRGAASVNLSNQPLIFIDGIRLVEGTIGLGQSGQVADRLNNINPEDIESMEVVKGPAAATLYGADASAGVIQIITKKGRAGVPRFSQNLTLETGSVDQGWTPPDNFANCSAALVASTSTNPLCRGQAVGTLVSDNPLVREGAFRKGQIGNFAYSASGGGQGYGYFFSVNRDQQTGTLPNNEFGRSSIRTNFNFVPDPRVTVNATIGLQQSRLRAPDNDNNIYGYLGGGLLGTPTSRNDAGTGNNGWFGFNRNLPAIRAIDRQLYTRGTTTGITVSYVPVSWFTHKLTVGGDLTWDEQFNYFPKNGLTQYGGLTDGGSNSQARNSVQRYTFDYTANARREFGESKQWELNATAGLQAIMTRSEGLSALGTGFVVNSNNVINAASQTSAGGSEAMVRQRGWVGQAQLGHLNRRFLQVGVRVDEFSVFGSEADPAILPKIGGSWVVSDENFYGGFASLMNTLRLRAAWGQTGRAPGAGAALVTLAAAPSISGSSAIAGAVPANPGNAGLKPERGTELELGFDASFFNEKLALEVTYFDKTTNDLILSQPLPPSLGFTQNPSVNVGSVTNKGLEVTLSTTPIEMRNFRWDLRGGFATLENKLTDLGGINAFGTLNRFTEGYQLGSWVSKTIRSINDSTGVVTVADTLEVVGNVFPTLEGTLTSTMTFFNQLRVTAQIDTKQDFLVYNNTEYFRETQLVRSNNRLDTLVLPRLERLRRYGNPTTGKPAFVQQNGTATTVAEARDGFLQPGDFVRLREVGVTWDLPKGLIGFLGPVETASLGLAVQNVKLWKDKGFTGADPEVISNGASQFGRDDFLTLPNPRTTVLRLNLTF